MLYHFCTNGLKKGLIFTSDQDFTYGMNAIGLCKLKFHNIRILAFCLMGNHIHFVIDSSEEEGISFMRYYKLLIGNYLKITYGKERSLKGADIGFKCMSDAEYCVNAIAYVLRNPISAGLLISPTEYRWSSACLYFGSRIFRQEVWDIVKNIGRERLRSITHSHGSFPDDWRINNNGLIFPGEYTDYKDVEIIFGKPAQLIYHITKNNDLIIEQDTGILSKFHYSDEELCESRNTLILNHFRKKQLTELSIEEKISLASMMKKRYRLLFPTLSRLVGINRQILRQLL